MKLYDAYSSIEYMLENENSSFEAKQIIYYVFDIDATKLIFERNTAVNDDDFLKCVELAKKRNEGTPLYYILGKTEFYSLEFFVGEGVLIPRPDTETLVDVALGYLRDLGKENPKVLDLCSGSGCVAISIAKNFDGAQVDAVELSEKAYKYLTKNIDFNKAKNVKPIKADALQFFGEYDLIVSNPPYIAQNEKKQLDKEVLKEPDMALFAGEDGMIFYREICENFSKSKNFALAFEVGYLSDSKVVTIMENNGYNEIKVTKDLNNVNRVVFGKK